MTLSVHIMRAFDSLNVKGFDAVVGLSLAHDVMALEQQAMRAAERIRELEAQLADKCK